MGIICEKKAQKALKKRITLILSVKFANGGGIEIRTLAGLAPTIGFQDRPLQPLGYASIWWSIQGLNLRPNDYKSFALTTALMDPRLQRSLNIITKRNY